MDPALTLGASHETRITTLLAIEQGVLHTFTFPCQEAIPTILAPILASFGSVVLVHLADNGIHVGVL